MPTSRPPALQPLRSPGHDPLLRNLWAFRRDPIAFLQRARAAQGPLATFRFGPQPVVLVSSPEGVKDILVTHARKFTKGLGLRRAKRLLGEGLLTSEGEFHRRQRRLAQPAFHRDRINAYGQLMVDHGARARDRWVAGAETDVAEDMMRLTLAIVGKTLFGADVESEAGEIGEALTDAMELFRSATLPFADLLYRLPLPMTRRLHRAKSRLDGTIYRIIRERRESGEDRGDLLSMLLMATDTEGDGGDGRGMTDLNLRDEAITLFLAGHETTANALTWTWYLLSQHPEVEARFHQEVDTVLGGRLPTTEDLSKLPYTRMVMSESMRLYPPAWLLGRLAQERHEAVGQGGERLVVQPGTLVLMSQYLMHRDPAVFPDPERFDPDRFDPARKAERPLFSYFPFGGGPRVCIGESFAWMEGVLLLATIAQRWRFRLVPGHRVALQPLVTLRPRYGMRMVPEARDEAPRLSSAASAAATAPSGTRSIPPAG